MLILAIDTAGPSGSIALCRCGEGAHAADDNLIELVPLAGRTFSAQLMPQIAALLARHHLDKHAIDAFAAASGPGSFTGLRVGLSTVKALAEIMNRPIAAVSLLEAIAWAGMAEERVAAERVARVSDPGSSGASDVPVIAALDAMRGEVYVGEYMLRPGALPQLLREVLLPVKEFAAEAQLSAGSPILTPDESVAAAVRTRGREAAIVPRPQSDVIARLGALKIVAGEVTSSEELDANYLRRSDAEIFSKGSS